MEETWRGAGEHLSLVAVVSGANVARARGEGLLVPADGGKPALRPRPPGAHTCCVAVTWKVCRAGRDLCPLRSFTGTSASGAPFRTGDRRRPLRTSVAANAPVCGKLLSQHLRPTRPPGSCTRHDDATITWAVAQVTLCHKLHKQCKLPGFEPSSTMPSASATCKEAQNSAEREEPELLAVPQ